MLAVIPGRSSPAAPSSSALTSIVPLDGSTTGLTMVMRAVCFSPGMLMEVTVISDPVFTLPANFSGSNGFGLGIRCVAFSRKLAIIHLRQQLSFVYHGAGVGNDARYDAVALGC